MQETCPTCGLSFYREHGYFVGAMYFSYALAGLIGIPLAIVIHFLNLTFLWVIMIPAITLFALTPWIFQYSRVLWLHLDQWFDPR
jgi:hypothetical protein